MSNDVVLRTLTSSDYDDWEKLVAESPLGSIYALPSYLDVLCSSTGGSFSILGAFRGDELVGGIPLYEETVPGGRSLANRLLLFYSGIVLKPLSTKYPSKAVSKHLEILQGIAERLDQSPYARIILNHQGLIDARPFMQRKWNARPAYTYIVTISDAKSTWDRIEQNLRRLVTRCSEAGATLSDDDDFDSFYVMHVQTHERKGAPLYLPKEAFAKYFSTLRALGICRLYQARLKDGKAVAGQLVLLGSGGRTYTVCASADAEQLHIGTTPWLRWEVFKALSAEGFRSNDLTDASLNEVTRFKSQLGGDLIMNMVIQKPDSRAFQRHRDIQRLKARVKHVIVVGAKKILGRR